MVFDLKDQNSIINVKYCLETEKIQIILYSKNFKNDIHQSVAELHKMENLIQNADQEPEIPESPKYQKRLLMSERKNIPQKRSTAKSSQSSKKL